MNFQWLWPSLGRKVTIGYFAIAALMLGGAAVTFQELRVIEEKVSVGNRMSELFDNAMEIRRFERNYFLHRQESDYRENARYIAQMRDLLRGSPLLATTPEGLQRMGALRNLLNGYTQEITEYAAAVAAAKPARAGALELRVRSVGKDIVAITEAMAETERRQIQDSLAILRRTLVLSIAVLTVIIIMIGQGLSRSVVHPLKEMETSLDAVSSGRLGTLSAPSTDREIVAIINAFNHMLHELDLRQRYLLRAEKLSALGTMLSGVAHELNNPLSNIMSSCQILQEEMEEADPATRDKLLAQIEGQTERARTIVRSLLDFARDREFHKDSFALRPLIEETVGFIKGEVPGRVAVKIAVPGALMVFGDRQRLQQAFLNLIRNAVEVVDGEGRIEVSAERHSISAAANDETPWTSGCRIDGDVVDIHVRDDGPGIPPEVLPRIFDPFFTTKDVGKGMGLGLFVVYEVVDEHDGYIVAENAPEGGTTFHMRLPASTPSQDATAEQKQS
jgi:signal transduction histidine kinase